MDVFAAKDLIDPLRKTLRAWHKPPQESHPLAQLRLVSNVNAPPHAAAIALIESALRAVEPQYAALLHKRFKEDISPKRLIITEHIVEKTFHRWQNRGISQLATEIAARENRLRNEAARLLETALEPQGYDRLFGCDDVIDKLCHQILEAGRNPITAVAGIGGIGKTAVVDRATRIVLRHFQFEHVVWLRYEAPTMHGRSLSADSAHTQLLQKLSLLPHIDATRLPPAERSHTGQ